MRSLSGRVTERDSRQDSAPRGAYGMQDDNATGEADPGASGGVSSSRGRVPQRQTDRTLGSVFGQDAQGRQGSNMRYWAAESLGKFGPDAQAAVPDLVAALKDESKMVRMGAAYALGEIGSAVCGARTPGGRQRLGEGGPRSSRNRVEADPAEGQEALAAITQSVRSLVRVLPVAATPDPRRNTLPPPPAPAGRGTHTGPRSLPHPPPLLRPS
jgi:HEAT repeats